MTPGVMHVGRSLALVGTGQFCSVRLKGSGKWDCFILQGLSLDGKPPTLGLSGPILTQAQFGFVWFWKACFGCPIFEEIGFQGPPWDPPKPRQNPWIHKKNTANNTHRVEKKSREPWPGLFRTRSAITASSNKSQVQIWTPTQKKALTAAEVFLRRFLCPAGRYPAPCQKSVKDFFSEMEAPTKPFPAKTLVFTGESIRKDFLGGAKWTLSIHSVGLVFLKQHVCVCVCVGTCPLVTKPKQVTILGSPFLQTCKHLTQYGRFSPLGTNFCRWFPQSQPRCPIPIPRNPEIWGWAVHKL